MNVVFTVAGRADLPGAFGIELEVACRAAATPMYLSAADGSRAAVQWVNTEHNACGDRQARDGGDDPGDGVGAVAYRPHVVLASTNGNDLVMQQVPHRSLLPT